MSNAIAERELTLDGAGPGFVRIYAPQQDAAHWRCDFHLSWPGFDQRESALGEDSYQAVKQAFRAVPLYISRTEAYRAGKLSCWGEGLAGPPHKIWGDYPTTLQAMFHVSWISEDEQ